MKLLTLLTIAFAAFAQEATAPKPTPAPRVVSRVIEFVLDDGEKMQKIAGLFAHRLNRIIVEPSVGLLVMTGNEADVNEVEAAIKRYYKPKPLEPGFAGPPNRNFEINLQVLHASSEGNLEAVPATLLPVVQQLKQVTRLTSFRVIESQILRVRSGEEVEATGVLQWPGVPEKVSPMYQLRGVVKPKGVLIQCDKLRFGARIPYLSGAPDSYQFQELLISTSVDLKPNQLTVIGKANASVKDGALILVLTAKLAD